MQEQDLKAKIDGFYNFFFPELPKKKKPVGETHWKYLAIYKRACKLFAATAATTAIPYYFGKNARWPATVSLLLCRNLLLTVLYYRTVKAFFTKPENRKTKMERIFSPSLDRLTDFCWIAIANIAAPFFAIHELGHIALAKTLFTHSQARLSSFAPFTSATTTFTPSNGTRFLFRRVPREFATGMVICGGMVSSLLSAEIYQEISVESSAYPRVCSFFNALAHAQVLQETCNALGAVLFDRNNRKNDVVALANHFHIPRGALVAAIPTVYLAILASKAYFASLEQQAKKEKRF